MRPFLRAQWRHVALLNYVIDPRLLAPYVPAGTELDLWRDRAYVSLVGFLFRDTRVLGLPVPFHRHFEEVNLRLYGPPFEEPLREAPVSSFLADGSPVTVYKGKRLP